MLPPVKFGIAKRTVVQVFFEIFRVGRGDKQHATGPEDPTHLADQGGKFTIRDVLNSFNTGDEVETVIGVGSAGVFDELCALPVVPTGHFLLDMGDAFRRVVRGMGLQACIGEQFGQKPWAATIVEHLAAEESGALEESEDAPTGGEGEISMVHLLPGTDPVPQPMCLSSAPICRCNGSGHVGLVNYLLMTKACPVGSMTMDSGMHAKNSSAACLAPGHEVNP